MDAPTPETALFETLGLHPSLVAAVTELGYTEATPIQAASIPALLAGRDMVGQARTGSGKTAAFGLPLLHKMLDGDRKVRSLVLVPTRELAIQVSESLREMCQGMPIRVATVYGGAPYPPQLQALQSGAQIVVGTPGRLIDHLERKSLDLSRIEMMVLDEADEMLRMGFIDDVERLLSATPDARQLVLFSATMPDPIRRLADTYLKNPATIQVETRALSVDHIRQEHMLVPHRHKLEALMRVLAAGPDGATLVFVRTRADCAAAAERLSELGVQVEALHGDLNQGARERVLQKFRAERIEVVIATDVAARGLDIDHITRIINFDMPGDTETYVHRIGRTGRAGREGYALSFVTPTERRNLRFMERQLNVRIDQVPVPSERDVIVERRRRFGAMLAENLTNAPADARAYVGELLGSGWSAEDLAVAAIAQLASMRDVPLVEPPPEPPREKAYFERIREDRSEPPQRSPDRGAERNYDRPTDRPPERRERPTGSDRPREERPRYVERHDHRDDRTEERPRHGRAITQEVPVVELFFAVGARNGLRPGDIVGALANEVGVPGEFIGRVTILPRKSFVSLPADVAERVVQMRPRLLLRGSEVTPTLARGR